MSLRNTKQIHEAFGPLAPTRMTSRGGEGAEVQFLPASTAEAVDVADQAVGLMLEIGWFPGSIALMTTGKRHYTQVQETERLSKKGYWRAFWADEEVFYGHVLGCKGLERPAVVLCLNESAGLDRSREKLYVGMSRATDHLIVVGDPDVVRGIGGPRSQSVSGSDAGSAWSGRHDRFAARRALHRVDRFVGASLIPAVLAHPSLVTGHGRHRSRGVPKHAPRLVNVRTQPS